MNLLDIKKHLMTVKIASLAALSQYFNCEAGMLRCMLNHWVQKGSVRKFSQSSPCGKSCGSCVNSCATEIYEWVQVY